MVDGTVFGDSFEQDRSWDDSGSTISGIYGTHQNSIRVRMPVHSLEQDRAWDDSGTTISGIYGTHQNSIRVRMPVLIVVPQVNSKLGSFFMKNHLKIMKNHVFFSTVLFF